MQYFEENDIGYLGWSWKGNGGGVEYLDIAVEWDGSVLSADWGEVQQMRYPQERRNVRRATTNLL